MKEVIENYNFPVVYYLNFVLGKTFILQRMQLDGNIGGTLN